jgi:hypothetical protein
MKVHNSSSADIGSEARALLKAARVGPAELEAIVTRSGAFEAVLRNIEAQQAIRPAAASVRPGFLPALRLAGGSLAAVAMLAFAASFFLTGKQAVNVPPVAVVQTPAADLSAASFPASRPAADEIESEPLAVRASVKQAVDPPVRRAAAKPRTAVGRPAEAVRDKEFYEVSYAGDARELAAGRVIRVELPPAALFAMGINVPLENASSAIKADLLVGPDGVARAMRLVE